MLWKTCICLKMKNDSQYGNVIDDLNMVLNSLYSWHVQHVKRLANIVAHCLVKVTLQQLSEQI